MTSRHSRGGGLTTVDPHDESDRSSNAPATPHGPRHQTPTGGRHGGGPGQQPVHQQFGTEPADPWPSTDETPPLTDAPRTPRLSATSRVPGSSSAFSLPDAAQVAPFAGSGLAGRRLPEKAEPARKWPWLLLAVATLVVGIVIGRAGATTTVVPPAPPVTVTAAAAPPPAAPTAPSTPAKVTLPTVSGKNGALVGEQLRQLGLTKVQFASRDDEDTVVVNPANWTAVKIQPGVGTKVAPDATVVVTMTKEN